MYPRLLFERAPHAAALAAQPANTSLTTPTHTALAAAAGPSSPIRVTPIALVAQEVNTRAQVARQDACLAVPAIIQRALLAAVLAAAVAVTNRIRAIHIASDALVVNTRVQVVKQAALRAAPATIQRAQRAVVRVAPWVSSRHQLARPVVQGVHAASIRSALVFKIYFAVSCILNAFPSHCDAAVLGILLLLRLPGWPVHAV